MSDTKKEMIDGFMQRREKSCGCLATDSYKIVKEGEEKIIQIMTLGINNERLSALTSDGRIFCQNNACDKWNEVELPKLNNKK